MISSLRPLPFAALLSLAVLSLPALAVDDIPAVDPKPILQSLKVLRDQQAAQVKAARLRFMQEATAAAGNSARAVELWEEAIRATQFQGAPKENAQFHDWKEKEGEALKDKEVLSALHLYFQWLALTLQRSAGAETKVLLPAVLNQAREVQADQLMMDAFEDNLKREKEALQNAPRKPNAAREKEKQKDNEATKRMHDQILKQGLAGSAYVQWMHLGEIVGEVAPARKRGGGADEGSTSWEGSPGNYDGLFTQIILPELRLLKDVRVLEYWDSKIRRETENASKARLAFDVDKFNQIRRPQLVWSRSADLVKIGQKNRGINEMFALIKANPSHPDAASWMTELEGLLAPPQPASISTMGATPAPVVATPVEGTVVQ